MKRFLVGAMFALIVALGGAAVLGLAGDETADDSSALTDVVTPDAILAYALEAPIVEAAPEVRLFAIWELSGRVGPDGRMPDAIRRYKYAGKRTDDGFTPDLRKPPNPNGAVVGDTIKKTWASPLRC